MRDTVTKFNFDFGTSWHTDTSFSLARFQTRFVKHTIIRCAGVRHLKRVKNENGILQLCHLPASVRMRAHAHKHTLLLAHVELFKREGRQRHDE